MVEPLAIEEDEVVAMPIDKTRRLSSTATTIVCGVALMSDGYITYSIGVVMTILKRQYGKEAITSSKAFSHISSFTYLGMIIGMLSFGWVTDRFGRKAGMLSANTMLIVFSIACAACFSADGSTESLFVMLLFFRTLLGIGMGAEYPTGSVGAREATAETKATHRHGLYIGVTNVAIDFGWALAGFVAFLLAVCLGETRLEIMWRLTIAIGVIIPLITLYYRMKIVEPAAYTNHAMYRIPYGLVFKKYWRRLFAVSLIWFIYDLNAYPFGLYSSSLTEVALNTHGGSVPTLAASFGWGTLTLLFYLPGAVAGAFLANRIGPKSTMIVGILLQSAVGICLSIVYEPLVKYHIAGFAALYGFFLALGEMGPGDTISILASSSCPSAIRGQFYGIAAAIGKAGAYLGVDCFVAVQRWCGGGDPDSINGQRGVFFIASLVNLIAAFVCFTMVPNITQNVVEEENERFRKFLINNDVNVETELGDRRGRLPRQVAREAEA